MQLLKQQNQEIIEAEEDASTGDNVEMGKKSSLQNKKPCDPEPGTGF